MLYFVSMTRSYKSQFFCAHHQTTLEPLRGLLWVFWSLSRGSVFDSQLLPFLTVTYCNVFSDISRFLRSYSRLVFGFSSSPTVKCLFASSYNSLFRYINPHGLHWWVRLQESRAPQCPAEGYFHITSIFWWFNRCYLHYPEIHLKMHDITALLFYSCTYFWNSF